MKTFSDPTIGRLIDLADKPTKSRLQTLFLQADLAQFDPPRSIDPNRPPTKADMVAICLTSANTAADSGNAAARKALLDFVRLLVEELRPYMAHMQEQFDALRDALVADGYELNLSPAGSAALLPTEPSAAPLAPAITALEAELGRRGYATALTHYKQAVGNLVDGNWEAANGSARSALEDLVIELAVRDGYTRTTAANQGTPAIRHLVEKTGTVPPREGGTLLQGLWAMSHTNGPHPGQSNPQEARGRLLLLTETARIVLTYFPV